MNKTTLILVALLLGFGLHNASAQLQPSGFDYSNPKLSYYRITDEIKYTEIDFSRLKLDQEEDLYYIHLPFTVSKAAPAGELFWLLLYIPESSKFNRWGIFNSNDNFICKSLSSYNVNGATYIVQSQNNLTEQITAGEYTLLLAFNDRPTGKDVQVSVAYSSQEILDEFIEVLEANQTTASSTTATQQQTDKSSQLVGTKWSWGEIVEDDWISAYEIALQFSNNNEVAWYNYVDEWEPELDYQIGSYTLNGKEGTIKLKKDSYRFIINGNKLTLKRSGKKDLVLEKVSKFKYIKQ